LRCSLPDCGHKISFEVGDGDNPPIFPKVDPQYKLHGNWIIELQGQVKSYWKTAGPQISFRERSDAIAGHLAGGLQLIESLRYDLDSLSDAMTRQFSGEWEMLTSFLRLWNPAKIQHFIKQPFLSVPVPSQDEFVKQRSRLLLHPNFFIPDVGCHLNNVGGFYWQLISPYTSFSFPVESWLAAICGIPDSLDIRVVGYKLIGKDLIHCWKDVPGSRTEDEHLVDAPAIRISDSKLARPWLARLGIRPWGDNPLSREKKDECYPSCWTYFDSTVPTVSQRLAWEKFEQRGRLAYFAQDRLIAWELAVLLAGFLFGEKLALITNPNHQETYRQLVRESRDTTHHNKTLHWKVVQHPDDLTEIPWSSFKFVILDYYADMDPAVLEALYNYTGRLLIIHNDPLLDLAGSNMDAALLHGLVNCVHYQEHGKADTPFSYKQAESSLVVALLEQWKHDHGISI
jgi:hypothetical protein